MRKAIVVALAACSSGEHAGTGPDAAVPPADARPADVPSLVDLDLDGLDDARELQLAKDYLPFLSLDDDDGCPRSGLVARVRTHPDDATKIVIIYSHLFERDCGLNGHVGDNEGFGIAIDPTLPSPAGILAIRTAAHQNTVCERITECSTCTGDSRPTCDRAPGGDESWPVLYASKGKHGQYASLGSCPLLGTCLDRCTLATTPARPPVVNVGEPGAPLVHDLTAAGLITPGHGWTETELMNFDPWNAAIDFGSAGNVAGDLTDPTFIPRTCSL